MTETALTRTPFIATRRQIFAGGAALAAVGMSNARATAAHAATPAAQPQVSSGVDRATIQRWARDTWASLAAMTDPKTGLPADNISGPLASPTRSGYTSPTNIGGY
ncbi:MAG: cellobiose phosphorylase, partial [Dermatophilaceae bacterium]